VRSLRRATGFERVTPRQFALAATVGTIARHRFRRVNLRGPRHRAVVRQVAFNPATAMFPLGTFRPTTMPAPTAAIEAKADIADL